MPKRTKKLNLVTPCLFDSYRGLKVIKGGRCDLPNKPMGRFWTKMAFVKVDSPVIMAVEVENLLNAGGQTYITTGAKITIDPACS